MLSPKRRMEQKLVLRVVGRSFVPFILLFGFYVQFHGDYGPGGGFQAGVIVAAGVILYALVFGLEATRRAIPPDWTRIGTSLGVLLFGGVGIASMLLGGNFLGYDALDPKDPKHGQHVGILLVELGVGITVASTMLLFYYAFAARKRPAS